MIRRNFLMSLGAMFGMTAVVPASSRLESGWKGNRRYEVWTPGMGVAETAKEAIQLAISETVQIAFVGHNDDDIRTMYDQIASMHPFKSIAWHNKKERKPKACRTLNGSTIRFIYESMGIDYACKVMNGRRFRLVWIHGSQPLPKRWINEFNCRTLDSQRDRIVMTGLIQ